MASSVAGNIQFTIRGVNHVVDISSIKNTISFERHFNVSAQVLAMSPRVEYIAFMAWSAAVADGLDVPDDFDKFVDVLDNIEVMDADETAVNPTDGGQSADL